MLPPLRTDLPIEDFQLVSLVQSGSLEGYLGRYIGRSDVGDDLAQEVFLTAYRDLASYNGRDPFGIWLLGIARHRDLMYLRTEVRRRTREAGSAGESLDEWRLQRAENEIEDLTTRERELAALQQCSRGCRLAPQRSCASTTLVRAAWSRSRESRGKKRGRFA